MQPWHTGYCELVHFAHVLPFSSSELCRVWKRQFQLWLLSFPYIPITSHRLWISLYIYHSNLLWQVDPRHLVEPCNHGHKRVKLAMMTPISQSFNPNSRAIPAAAVVRILTFLAHATLSRWMNLKLKDPLSVRCLVTQLQPHYQILPLFLWNHAFHNASLWFFAA